MNKYPAKYIQEIIRHIVLCIFLMAGGNTVVQHLLFNESQTKGDVIQSMVIGFLLALFFFYGQKDKWKAKLEEYRKDAKWYN